MKKTFVFILLFLYLFLNIASAFRESLTYDEPVHLKAGIEEWQTRAFSLDANNPPLVREIAALLVIFGLQKLIIFPHPVHQYFPSRLMITFLGIVLAKIITLYAGWDTVITVKAIIAAFIISVAEGVIFGLYPAKKASELEPIEALRYE